MLGPVRRFWFKCLTFTLIPKCKGSLTYEDCTKAYWAHFRREKNYIFRELTRNFRESNAKPFPNKRVTFVKVTRNFRELTVIYLFSKKIFLLFEKKIK